MNNRERYYRSVVVRSTSESTEKRLYDKIKKSKNFKDVPVEQRRNMQKKAARAKTLNSFALSFIICLMKHADFKVTDIAKQLGISRKTAHKHLQYMNYLLKDGKIHLQGPFKVSQLKESFSKCSQKIESSFINNMQDLDVDGRTLYEILRHYDLIDDLTRTDKIIQLQTIDFINKGKVEIYLLCDLEKV